MDKRSRYSGRSWCSMVAMDACRFATWASRAIVTLSRNRRCTRVLTVRRNHVAAADTPSPIAAPWTNSVLCSKTPLLSSISHKARSASGSAASCESTNEANISPGSCRYPNLHKRHIDESAGGSGSIACFRLGEDVIGHALLVCRNVEAFRLQIEHGSVAPADRHQLRVRAEFNYPSMLEHTDAVCMPDRGKPMRNQDRRAVAGRR